MMTVMHRHLFRMTYWENIQRFIADGAIYAKNYQRQPQHSISYGSINSRRGNEYTTPCGNSVHDYLPFYFSPCTAMAYAIHAGKVPLKDPTGEEIRAATRNDVAFIVSYTKFYVDREFYFTDIACNTVLPAPRFSRDFSTFNTLIEWPLFDEEIDKAAIPEIGYAGVSKWQHNRSGQGIDPRYLYRSSKRMAEFMVKDQIPLQYVCCIVTSTPEAKVNIEDTVKQAGLEIPVYYKPDCYY